MNSVVESDAKYCTSSLCRTIREDLLDGFYTQSVLAINLSPTNPLLQWNYFLGIGVVWLDVQNCVCKEILNEVTMKWNVRFVLREQTFDHQDRWSDAPNINLSIKYITKLSWKHFFGIDTSTDLTIGVTWPVHWPVKILRFDWVEEETEVKVKLNHQKGKYNNRSGSL